MTANKSLIKLPITLFLSLLVFSCGKGNDEPKTEDLPDTITMCYAETDASDPWFNYERKVSDSTLTANACSFLVADTINIINILIKHDGIVDGCKSAFCKTGRKIKVEITRKDLERIKKYTFYEC